MKIKYHNLLTSTLVALIFWAVGPNGILGLDISSHSNNNHHEETILRHSSGSGHHCSTCDNSNVKCMLMSFIYTQPQMTPGYTRIATIPKSACHINITQLRPTRNFLAVRNSDGSFALNGNWQIQKSGIYEIGGAKFVYIRTENSFSTESITATGPLIHPVDIMLMYRVPNPGIKYEYKIPSGIPIPMLGPTATSTNEQIAPPSIDLRRLDRPPADEAPRLSNRALRNRSRKKYSWRLSQSRTPCSKTCGGGVQTQIVLCIREFTQTPVHERRCLHSEKPPVSSIRCATQACPAQWVATWSPCSITCGKGGEQMLTSLECKQEISSQMIVTVKEASCLDAKPPSKKPCFVEECNVTSITDNNEIISNDLNQEGGPFNIFWRTGPWSQCSTTCGIGFRTRVVSCHGGIRSTDCPPQQRPVSREICDTLQSCPMESNPFTAAISPNHTSNWLYTEWSENCEDDCGMGHQYRRVACLQSNSSSCSDRLKPETRRACSSDRHCSGKWYTGPWGRCVDPCSSSPIQKREVLCIVHVKGQSRIVSDRACSVSNRPETERPCHEIHCPSQWFVSDWGVCNSVAPNDCGNSIQRREVRCLDKNLHDSNSCHNETPPVKRSCDPAHCSNQDSINYNRSTPSDQPSLNSSCIDRLDRCRTAVQARLCQYEYYKTKCCLSCSRAPEIARD